MRNDLGRVCDFGSVKVDKLCEVEEHPSLFHLVSTVRGKLRTDAKISDIVRALFPCGSITGAPKIRTMEIIDELESVDRGLSMGAIGVYVPEAWNLGRLGIDTVFDLSVAIRTMVIRENEAVFSVGGGVVIDSEPEKEFEESVLKAKALVDALGAASNWPQDPEPRRFPGV
jgi:anthranilate/para-aminobenzoate synthase component I